MADTTSTNAKGQLKDFSIYKEAEDSIKKLADIADDQFRKADINRKLRFAEVQVELERKNGNLAPDELYIPIHLIDTNIRREQAKYIAYVNGRRTGILVDVNNPAHDTTLLEDDFTLRARYDGWQLPWYRLFDGMQLHGYGIMERLFDETKPGHFGLDDIDYADLGFSCDLRDIQSAEMLVVNKYFTRTQLIAMTQLGWKFDSKQVQNVVTWKQDNDATNVDYSDNSMFKVQKVFFRKDGVVQVAWACHDKCDGWLREPRPLYMGRKQLDPTSQQFIQVFETVYPLVVFPYTICENTKLMDLKGRAYMDQDVQEASSSLMSSFVTAHRRASGFYLAKDENDPNNDVAEQKQIHFKQGYLINSKVKQFQLQAPSSDLLGAIQALITQNGQETAQVNYAAMNRQDSRKTATEIQAAQAESMVLSSIQVALLATGVKQVYQPTWDIFQSRMLAGDIKPGIAPLEEYAFKYVFKPAGDADVIEKQEKIVKMQQAWPVVAGTPLAPAFLKRLITLMFPEESAFFSQALEQESAAMQLVQKLAIALQGAVKDLPPEIQAENAPALEQLKQEVMMVMQPQGQQPKQSQPQQQSVGGM